MTHIGKSRVTRRDEQSPASLGDAQDGAAPPQTPASRLLAKQDAFTLAQWAAAIAAAAAALRLSGGTSFHQLAIGVLGSLICVFVGSSTVEIVSRLTVTAWSRRRSVAAAAQAPDDRANDSR
jgi:hypothetical protein